MERSLIALPKCYIWLKNASETKDVLFFKPFTCVVFKMENAVVRKYNISLQIVIKGLYDQLTVLSLPSAVWIWKA